MNEALYGKKILFATVPDERHFRPLTGLAEYLQASGCDVRWYTSRIFEELLKKLSIPHFVFTRALDINPANLEYIFPERIYIADQPEKMNFDLLNIFAKRSSEYFADIKTIHDSFPFDLMISDNMFSAIPFVKAKLNIPVATIGITPLATDSADLGSYGMGLIPAVSTDQRDEYSRLRDFAATALYKRSIDAYDSVLKENGIFMSPSILYDQLIRASDLHLQIGTADFEYKRSDLGDNIRFAGALSAAAAIQTARKWFDKRLLHYDKIVIIEQCAAEKESKKLLEPALEAFKDSSNTLVIAVTNGNCTVALREKFGSPSTVIENFISLEQVLPYASVYITDGDYMAVNLSIRNQVPLITTGICNGKNEVGARVAYFNCGIHLNTELPEAEDIREATAKVISNDQYKKSVSRISKGFKWSDANRLCAGYLAELLHESEFIQAK
ncbi:MAG: glycosyltransferase [Pedobacter sp.]|uniref:glycosyltransferase n=1 Tax=Pedobacter sp. TaxID=1411316 RepID=UPI0033991369